MLRINPVLPRFAMLLAAVLALTGCSGNDATPTDAPAVSARATWHVPDGSTLTSAQMTSLFDSNQLYFNVKSAANSNGEIRGEITSSSSIFPTDAGDPFAPNPANAPVTFAAILGGEQVRPRNVVTSAKGYGSVTLDPQTKQLTGFIVTSGIFGNGAHIFEGLPGSSGAIGLPLEGGPVVWTVPAGTVLSDVQIARLSAGAFYFSVGSEAFPDGEIRGQLDQQVRSASLQGSSEVPPVASSASGVGFLALKQSTRQSSGFVKVAGFDNGAIQSITLRIGAAGTIGSLISSLENRGNGIWSLPLNTILSDAQVANFNNDELYFNVHTVNNIGGEVRGQILKSSIRIGTASLAGAKEAPPVSSQGTGTGTIAWNSVTGEVSGSVTTDGFIASATQIQSGSPTAIGPSLIDLTTSSPVTVIPKAGLSFALDIQPILTTNCTISFCHVTIGGITPMPLEPGVSFANVLRLIVPGNSAASFFVSRLTGATPPRMPKDRPSLGTTDLKLINDWIDDGALDN